MEATTPGIQFDADGFCNYCREFDARNARPWKDDREREEALLRVAEQIRREGKDREYDCIIGVSGGVDSTYAAYIAKQIGLRALAVHLDNGWDSELAVKNIENVLNRMGFDLYTHVIEWVEFRDLQRSFIQASVIDIEMLTDHAITALLYTQAAKRKIRFIVSGSNTATEGSMPTRWIYKKLDLKNIKAIHKKHGTVPIRTFPRQSLYMRLYNMKVRRIQIVPILNYIDYRKERAIETLEQKIGWKNYGGKHYESIFTRFYQGYILPNKFDVDKRRPHYSNLIRSGQMIRNHALDLLQEPIYPEKMAQEDRCYVLKKLGFSEEEFELYLSAPEVPHTVFPNYQRELRFLRFLNSALKRKKGSPLPDFT